MAPIGLTCWPRSTGSDRLMHKVSAHSRREFKAGKGLGVSPESDDICLSRKEGVLASTVVLGARR